MPLITWTDDLNVGIKQLDNEHKVLIEGANELFYEMTDGHDEELVEKKFVDLKERVSDHCNYEESLMQSYEYHNHEEHKGHHEDMLNALNVFWTRYKHDMGNIDADDLAKFFVEWLVIHIKYDAVEYKPFVQVQLSS